MISLKKIINSCAYNNSLEKPSVSISSPSGHILHLEVDKNEIITQASFEGPFDPWLSALCAIITGKHLLEALHLNQKDWEAYFGSEQIFWDLWAEREDMVWFRPLEMLKAAIDKFQGKEHLYKEASPLICRCLGVREEDIAQGVKTRAGMGCRSCLPQLNRLITIHQSRAAQKRRYFKEMTFADWLIITDEKLMNFPAQKEWGMEVSGFKGNGIVIQFMKEVSQKEEEDMAVKLQGFLGGLVDMELSFFLRRS